MAPQPGAYTSPLMARASGARLTVEMLTVEVPIIRAGEAAAAALEQAPRTRSAERARLLSRVRQGQKAKERVFAAALPLIRTVAVREYRRRQQWGSRIPLDDLMQEAIVGFFKGLSSFRTEAIRKSATNYLGQWMLVEMRRSAEVMDHDLQVGHDAGERFRRVRALRSRLLVDLGREPTDEEISDASRNAAYVTRPGLVGKAPPEGEAPRVGRGLTSAQVAEERTARGRVGRVMSLATGDGDDDGPGPAGVVDIARVTNSDHSVLTDPAELTAEAHGAEVISGLVSQALTMMALPPMQGEVVARRYGLAPYTEESSARSIARDMGVHRERVSRVLSAFSLEMTRPGGPFHRVVSKLDVDDLEALGLGWLADSLGPWDAKSSAVDMRISAVLTEDLREPAAAPAVQPTTDMVGLLAWYECEFDANVFSGMYPTAAQVPARRACPDCGKPADLVRTVTGSR
jgi:RNA polymerase sigma factor (sigma-70 family)